MSGVSGNNPNKTLKNKDFGDLELFFSLQEMIPFAVVGSDQEYQVNGKRILGRKTKWGTIEGNARRHTDTNHTAGRLSASDVRALTV